MWAIGRHPVTQSLRLDQASVATAPSGKIVVNEFDQSNVSNIFAVGDCAEGIPELTPVAVQAGKFLADRLFAGSSKVSLSLLISNHEQTTNKHTKSS